MQVGLLECKCCGAPLSPTAEMLKGRIVRCVHCGHTMTLAKEDEGKTVGLLRSAELLLDTCRFDEAYTAYSKAAELDEREPEAYFGMALARFKVQYLKDEASEPPRLQPICHEVTKSRFSDDKNYQIALTLATEAQRALYLSRAEEIDHIAKEFYSLAEANISYDCFLCVKVTDDGTRAPTEDSKDADYIYRLLQEKGYKPFYSEWELRNVTGADYEARILYALYTAECMLVVCRNEEYLRTKWVKNEYTRFLRLIDGDRKEEGSVAVVFYGRPVETLPGKKGKLQGIDFSLRESDAKIVSFVESHTPEARARRRAEAERAQRAAEEQTRQFEEMRRRLEESERLRKEEDEARRKREEEKRREQEEARSREMRALKEELAAMRQGPASQKEEFPEEETDPADFEIRNGVLKKYKGASPSVVLPKEVTKIAAYAFRKCTKLERITLPAGLREIERDAFSDCKSLKEVRISDLAAWCGVEIEEKSGNPLSFAHKLCDYGGREIFDISIPEGVAEIKKYAFSGCNRVRTLVLPDSVRGVGKEAFSGCSGLTGVTFRGGVTAIGSGAFSGCSGLTGTLDLPDSIRTIGERAFSGCSGLGGVVLPSALTYIEEETFYGCSGLTGELDLPRGVRKIGTLAFSDCSGLTGELRLPEGIIEIGEGAFSGCSGFTGELRLPEGVTVIEGHAFASCTKLKSVRIPASLKTIREDAFLGCSGLSRVDISDLPAWLGIEFDWENPLCLARHLFLNGEEVTSIAFPDGIPSIGDNALRGCSGLTGELVVPSTVTFIGAFAFADCPISRVVLPEGAVSIGSGALYGCDRLTELTLPFAGNGSDEGYFGWIFDSGFAKDNYKEVPSSLKKVTLTNCLSVAPDAFFGCGGITEIVLPENLTSIGANAFSGCSRLAEMVIPKGVNTIEGGAFFGCSSLRAVTIPKRFKGFMGAGLKKIFGDEAKHIHFTFTD